MKSPKASTLASSLPLHRWLTDDPLWQSKPLVWRTGRRWQALWGSVNWRLSQAIASQDPSDSLQDPILIVGPWRSGTTVMHELLTAACGYATPLTWQCMNACAFQLGRQSLKGPGIARPMDGLEINSDSPQEDEFALLTLGIPSAYRAFLMPHRISELSHALDQQFWLEHPEWLSVWEGFLRGVVRTTSTASQPLILKSPNHTFRLKSILKHFPTARMVWMARDPADVFHSNRKMWSSMFAMHGITQPNLTALDNFLTRAIQAAADTLIWCDENLPAAQCVICSIDQLRSAPVQTIGLLWKHLDAANSLNMDQLVKAVARTDNGRLDRYDTSIPEETSAALHALTKAQDDAMRRRGI